MEKGGGEGKSKHFNQIQYFVIDFFLPDIPCRILIMLLTLRYLAKAIGFVKVKSSVPGVISYISFICDLFL